MSDEALRRLLREAEGENDVVAWMRAAQQARRLEGGGLEVAASALDRAYGLAPDDADVVAARAEVLDRFEVREHGLVFRYVPAGPFLMGSTYGDADERPVHEVKLDAFWIADVPLSWASYCALMDWSPPGNAPWGGLPRGVERARPDVVSVPLGDGRERDIPIFELNEKNKVRRRYCYDGPIPEDDWTGPLQGALSYDQKPMVSVNHDDATLLVDRLGPERYGLPTEAQWEKAARGGLVGKRHAWGDEPPEGRCDFGGFRRFALLPSRAFPPNGYGLYGVCGGVFEWTSDRYDARAYERDGRAPPEAQQWALRGGSWADCAEAVTVSYRMSQEGVVALGGSPTIGFRLVRSA